MVCLDNLLLWLNYVQHNTLFLFNCNVWNLNKMNSRTRKDEECNVFRIVLMDYCFYLSIKFSKNKRNAIILSPKPCMHYSTRIIFKTTLGWHFFFFLKNLLKICKMGLWLFNKHCTLFWPNKLRIPFEHLSTLYLGWKHTMGGANNLVILYCFPRVSMFELQPW
jgi:hypothetical protein